MPSERCGQMNIDIVKARDLSDAWYQLVYKLLRGDCNRVVYTIDSGSYVGSKRLEYQYIVVQIDHPGTRPLIPDIPEHIGIPNPVESMQYVEDYFTNYLMNPELEENETYRYSTWIVPGVERVIEQLKGSAGNNQAVISVGGWAPNVVWEGDMWTEKDISPHVGDGEMCCDTDNFIDPGTGQRDPACLRLIDFRLDQDNQLHMVLYFRSWDLWGGFPANLAGLRLLQEYVADSLGAEAAKMVCSSKGLHLYSHSISVACKRVNLHEEFTLESWVEKFADLQRLNDA